MNGLIIVSTPQGPLVCTPTAYVARYQDHRVIEVIPARSSPRSR